MSSLRGSRGPLRCTALYCTPRFYGFWLAACDMFFGLRLPAFGLLFLVVACRLPCAVYGLRFAVCGSPFTVYGYIPACGFRLKMTSAARAKQAERMAEQQRTLKERAERAQRQRRAAAAAKKAARDKETETQARARCHNTVPGIEYGSTSKRNIAPGVEYRSGRK